MAAMAAMVTAAITSARASRRSAPDRTTVALLSAAAFLSVLALLAWQLRSTGAIRSRPIIVLRRIYVTRIVETVPGAEHGGSTVTQSVSGSATTSPAGGAVTRSS
jgi:hypothetical protein